MLGANTAYDFEQAAAQLQYGQPLLAAVLAQLGHNVDGSEAARQSLRHLVTRLRELDVAVGGGHTRTADVLQLYAATEVGQPEQSCVPLIVPQMMATLLAAASHSAC